ncbi:MAG: FkbM family methyltransferase [Pseudomonadota bacterium]
MDALHSEFVKEGDLAFDIGAHIGDRTASFRRLGARVVALEPQPRVFRALRLIHGRDNGCVLHQAAVGKQIGSMEMSLNTQNPTVSTLSPQFIAAAETADGWHGQVWDEKIAVDVTTLDTLVAEYGQPDFVKIDVEGHEHDVLTGLSVPLKALSFEFTTMQRSVACSCLSRLNTLGPYVFNISFGEEHRLQLADWVGPTDMKAIIEALPSATNSGDVFAKLG